MTHNNYTSNTVSEKVWVQLLYSITGKRENKKY